VGTGSEQDLPPVPALSGTFIRKLCHAGGVGCRCSTVPRRSASASRGLYRPGKAVLTGGGGIIARSWLFAAAGTGDRGGAVWYLSRTYSITSLTHDARTLTSRPFVGDGVDLASWSYIALALPSRPFGARYEGGTSGWCMPIWIPPHGRCGDDPWGRAPYSPAILSPRSLLIVAVDRLWRCDVKELPATLIMRAFETTTRLRLQATGWAATNGLDGGCVASL